MAELLSGKAVAAALQEELKTEAAVLREAGTPAALAILRVGEREDDLSYQRGATKRCESIGIDVKPFILPADVSEEALLNTIRTINEDPAIHGCLMLRPLPPHLNEEAACEALAPEKDVDGITTGSLAGVFCANGKGYAPCTPAACMEILNHYGIDPTGKEAVIIGRSLVVGKPLAMMLLQRNATVTICHTKTADMRTVCRRADILIAAAGRANMVDDTFLKEGQVILDVGINVNEEGRLCGDVDFAKAEPLASAITPVPGGVGAVTTVVLAKHVIEAAKAAVK